MRRRAALFYDVAFHAVDTEELRAKLINRARLGESRGNHSYVAYGELAQNWYFYPKGNLFKFHLSIYRKYIMANKMHDVIYFTKLRLNRVLTISHENCQRIQLYVFKKPFVKALSFFVCIICQEESRWISVYSIPKNNRQQIPGNVFFCRAIVPWTDHENIKQVSCPSCYRHSNGFWFWSMSVANDFILFPPGK